jgi:hypothetical protein
MDDPGRLLSGIAKAGPGETWSHRGGCDQGGEGRWLPDRRTSEGPVACFGCERERAVILLPVSLPTKLRVTTTETEHMPLYLRTFLRVLSSWVHQRCDQRNTTVGGSLRDSRIAMIEPTARRCSLPRIHRVEPNLQSSNSSDTASALEERSGLQGQGVGHSIPFRSQLIEPHTKTPRRLLRPFLEGNRAGHQEHPGLCHAAARNPTWRGR